MQILVVDDSSGMRRILASTLVRLGLPRPVEAEDAAAALDQLGRNPFNLAIIDWNMPGMSGLDLAHAIRSNPATANLPLLMVTGNGGSEDVVRALQSGFGGYIVKPFAEETLAQQLASLLQIEITSRRDPAPMIPANWTEWLASEAWARTDLRAIPPPPRSFREVFAVAGDSEVDVRRLLNIVSQDPVFTIRVLRLANVAAFAAAGEVTSVDIAVVRLGTRAVRNAVLAACLSAWAHTMDIYGKRGLEEAKHAVGTACLSRRLAERLRLTNDDAFVAGLVHDVGKLCLMKMRSDFRKHGGTLPSPEEFDAASVLYHAEIGAAALLVWGLPESIRVPTRWHHDPLTAPSHSQMAALTYTANRLSHRYGFGCPPESESDVLLNDPVCAGLGLDAKLLDALDQESLEISVTAQHLVS
jgi:HD-like signal output (HDOD) protein/CheY-like chemotaxis protein